MSEKYAPQRRKLLAFESEALPASGLIVRSPHRRETGQSRQSALSVPESVRALGEPLEPFFEACGGRQTISLSVRRSDNRLAPETYVFQQPFVLVGRCRESDLALNDRLVNFRHFYLQLIGGRWMFLDLRMIASGADSDSHRSSWGWFDREQELRVGPYTITRVGAHAQELSRPVQLTGPGRPEDLPIVDLEFITGAGHAHADQAWRVAGAVSLVGGSRQCDLWLRDESVSKVHASLVLTPRGLWVVDLLGRGSVLVNGRPAYWKQIHDGSRLQIGRYSFRVRYADQGGRDQRRHQDRAPEILATSNHQASPSGSLSEQSVMALIGHMAEMQNQFFEHSQNQMRFMAEMLAHLGRNQRESVQRDVARVEEITQELQELKAQLAAQPSPSAPRRRRKKSDASGRRRSPNPLSARLPGAPNSETDTSPAVATPKDPEAAPPGSTDMSRPERATVDPPERVKIPEEPVIRGDNLDVSSENAIPDPSADPQGEDDPVSSDHTADAHARLTERMARLAAERNAGWRRILDAFRG